MNYKSMSLRGGLIRPSNRITSVYNIMKFTCPDAIQAYSACVKNHYKLGNLEKGSCEKEFNVLKECFRDCRKRV